MDKGVLSSFVPRFKLRGWDTPPAGLQVQLPLVWMFGVDTNVPVDLAPYLPTDELFVLACVCRKFRSCLMYVFRLFVPGAPGELGGGVAGYHMSVTHYPLTTQRVKWMVRTRLLQAKRALDVAAWQPNISVLRGLRALASDDGERKMFKLCSSVGANFGRLDVLEWLHNECGVRISVQCVLTARKHQHTHVVRWACAEVFGERELKAYEDAIPKPPPSPLLTSTDKKGLQLRSIHDDFSLDAFDQ